MTKLLPEAPRLSYLKGQAKAFAQSLRENDTDALSRAREAHPRFAQPKAADALPFRLADAQFVLAREYGFDSWTKLKQYVAVRDPELLHEAFETVKDGWINVADVPGDPMKLKHMIGLYPGLINARIGEQGYTLLHFAAHRNYVEAVKILIAAGADVHAAANGGATPLAVALMYPAPDVARILEVYGRKPDNLRTAAGLGDLAGVKRFFRSDGSLSPDAGDDREEWRLSYSFAARPVLQEPADILNEALFLAAQNGRIEIARLLIERGAEANRISFIGTPLHWAALYGQRASVEYLLEVSADIHALDDEYSATPAGWADYFGHKDLAQYLTDRGTAINEEALPGEHLAESGKMPT